jgi:hypothetical protein
MADKRVVFVAFAVEDKTQRDFLRGQSLNTKCPFEYVDMSVREPYDSEWKERVRTRMRRSDGVVALISRNLLSPSGQKMGDSMRQRRKEAPPGSLGVFR